MSTGHAVDRYRNLNDEDVLAGVQRRDDGALAELYDRFGRLAFGLAYRILGERGQAEDVVQDAFLAVWRRADSFQAERGSVCGWLMSIVHNASIDRRRGRFKREQADLPLDDLTVRLQTDAEETFATVAEGIVAEQVRQALAGLPDEQRQAIELAYFGGLTQQEIATRTGAPLGTVKSRLRLGLHKLRALLQEAVADDAPPSPDVAGGGPRAAPA
jgi:RNA polymerase sigma-70 factor (ECF subfamily)